MEMILKSITGSSLLSIAGRLGLVVLLFMVACRDTSNPSPGKAAGAVSSAARDTAVNYDSLLTELLKLQTAILENPQDLRRIPPLIEKSFDTVSGAFLIAGRGVANPKFPEAAREASRKTAASYDGRMWGLHLKEWRTGSMRSFARPISGDIAYSKVLFERTNGDTLCQLIQIPIGSIIVK